MISVNYFKEDHKNLFREKAFSYIMDRRYSVDIDDGFDFEIAQAVYMINQR